MFEPTCARCMLGSCASLSFCLQKVARNELISQKTLQLAKGTPKKANVNLDHFYLLYKWTEPTKWGLLFYTRHVKAYSEDFLFNGNISCYFQLLQQAATAGNLGTLANLGNLGAASNGQLSYIYHSDIICSKQFSVQTIRRNDRCTNNINSVLSKHPFCCSAWLVARQDNMVKHGLQLVWSEISQDLLDNVIRCTANVIKTQSFY